ncbi:MAG: hypothetical protein HOY78_17160 [Saccharothrix sp.]|nr:hypothetical protein [Saccharothrix sp.]
MSLPGYSYQAQPARGGAAGRGDRRARAGHAERVSLVVALPPFWRGIVLLSVFSFGLRRFRR